MGHLQATDMASRAPLDLALSWHLSSNHFPPIHPMFLPVAKEAIEQGVEYLLTEDEEVLSEMVVLPNGIEKSYGDIIEELHLDPFVEQAYLAAVDGEEVER